MEGKAAPCRVRMECSTLRQIMREAGCWFAIQPLYKHPPLTRREKEGAGQSFTPEEAQVFVEVGLTMAKMRAGSPLRECDVQDRIGLWGTAAAAARRLRFRT
jgi:hypothetical protein